VRTTRQITLGRLLPDGGWRTRLARHTLVPLADQLLGLHTIERLYRQGRLSGLGPFEFVARALEMLQVTGSDRSGELVRSIPRQGPVLVVCNHPYGAIEALLLADALGAVRTDVKFLANDALRIFPEIAPLLVGTNPLRVTQRNLPSLRQCEGHLADGGVLVVFPAGRVSFERPADSGRMADGEWNRIVGHLALRTQATVLPVFFHGGNSRVFHRVGRIRERARMFLLPREMLGLRGRHIEYRSGRPLPPALWHRMDPTELTSFARLMTYMLERPGEALPPPGEDPSLPPLAPSSHPQAMAEEIGSLPEAQKLLDFRHFSVYYARADQMPAVMAQIARERERVFRELAEGSGAARDGDAYDSTYVQLFVWDQRGQAIVGAYRLGRTDALRRAQGAAGVYLSQMFEFREGFYAREDGGASLELGRSFVVPEHQKSFHALYLLWQGIGRYLVAHPQYRRLYGTVSLSRRYDDRALRILCDGLIEDTPSVRPRKALPGSMHPEWQEYLKRQGPPRLALLSALVQALDAEGKDVPVLLKHYHKLGARFHCVAVDPNFLDTPGLLLSVDIPAMGTAAVETFLGSGAADYLAWRPGTAPSGGEVTSPGRSEAVA
jgi:putative hemolysin